MKSEKVTKTSILKSKARMMADRNVRFAIVEEELKDLREGITVQINNLTTKIKSQLDKEDQRNFE